MIKILALFGKSGSGKDTIQKVLLETNPKDFHRVVSCTTRPKRENEIEGLDYYFIDEPHFLEGMMRETFIEALEFNKWFYGTLIGVLDKEKINVGVFTPGGIEALFDTAGSYNLDILPIYIDCSDKTRFLRMLNREKNPDVREMCRRYFTDEEDFDIIDYESIMIYNDNVKMKPKDFVPFIVKHCEDFFD